MTEKRKKKPEEEGRMLRKCVLCGYEEYGEEDILFELAERNGDPFPELCCPRCGQGPFVPKEVYDAFREYVSCERGKKSPLGRPEKKRKKEKRTGTDSGKGK